MAAAATLIAAVADSITRHQMRRHDTTGRITTGDSVPVAKCPVARRLQRHVRASFDGGVLLRLGVGFGGNPFVRPFVAIGTDPRATDEPGGADETERAEDSKMPVVVGETIS